MKINDIVIINEPQSMNHECSGIIVEILPDSIYKVVFMDLSFGYHEGSVLQEES